MRAKLYLKLDNFTGLARLLWQAGRPWLLNVNSQRGQCRDFGTGCRV